MITTPPNFFRNWKENGFKKAAADFKYNYAMQETIEWQTKKLIFGYSSTILGLIGLLIYFIVTKPKAYIFYVLICFGFLLVTYTQLKAQLKARQMIKTINELDLTDSQEKK